MFDLTYSLDKATDAINLLLGKLLFQLSLTQGLVGAVFFAILPIGQAVAAHLLLGCVIRSVAMSVVTVSDATSQRLEHLHREIWITESSIKAPNADRDALAAEIQSRFRSADGQVPRRSFVATATEQALSPFFWLVGQSILMAFSGFVGLRLLSGLPRLVEEAEAWINSVQF